MVRFAAVAKYTNKIGIDFNALRYNTTLDDFLSFEEMMYIDNDYELAGYKDNEPKQ